MKQQKERVKFKPVIATMLMTLGLSTWSPLGYAVSDRVNFDVKVSIVAKTCTVNNNDPIAVEFGLMIINKIKEGIYEQNIPYTIDCDGLTDGQGLRLQFIGSPASFNSSLLKTTEPDLGLQFKLDGQPFAVNTWKNFTYTNTLPPLSVLAVASDIGGVDNEEFYATAVFNVEYQ